MHSLHFIFLSVILQTAIASADLKPNSDAHSVSNYQVTRELCTRKGNEWILIRKFQQGNKFLGLAVDPERLTTTIIPLAELRCETIPSRFAATRFGQMLTRAKNHSSATSNAGLDRSNQNSHVFMTTDLCPSSKNFEQKLYQMLHMQNLPFAIAISGSWINQHPDELAFLKQLAEAGSQVTWVNHSLTHPYVPGIPDDHNFLLMPHLDISQEILGNEKKMVENGLTPSVFFRFPGLISSRELIEEVVAWGLLPLGADAWLALDQPARPGSVILVHGNGNEPRGIRLFFQNFPELLKIGFDSLANL